MPPLKVALVLETSGGGSGRHVLDLAQELSDRGQGVVIVWSPRRAEDGFRRALVAIRGVKTIKLPLRREVGIHDIGDLRRLAEILGASGPFDILHGHSSKAGALVRLLPKRFDAARIYTPHAFRTMDPAIGVTTALVYGRIECALARRTDRIIAVSTAERDHAMSLGIPSHQITVVPNGADPSSRLDRTQARALMGVPADAIATGFVGRMTDQKDPMRFVEVIRAATKRAPEIHGVVMGEGVLFDRAKAAARGLPITFMGWCDAPSLMSGLDLLCVTSRYEALAYSFLEAIHAGIPIVSTDVGGIEETVLDGQTGFVLPVDAPPHALAERVTHLARDAVLRAQFSRSAFAHARELTLEAMAERTLAVYHDALSTSGTRRRHAAETPF